MGRLTFNKEERLKKEKDIQELFKRGSSFYLFPFKIIVLSSSQPTAKYHQIVITVSKKHFKRAVDRNLIKRRIREAYRIQKDIISESPKIFIAFIYTHKEIIEFAEFKGRLALALERLAKMGGKSK